MNLIEAVKLCALHDVTAKVHTRDYFFRHVMRWYSKTFSTPLHIVQELPVHDILVAFYEERYEAMDIEELEQSRALLIETQEERAKREADEAALEADENERVREIEAEEAERLRRIEEKRNKKLVEEGSSKGQAVFETVGGDKARFVFGEEESRPAKGRAPLAPADEPLISMKFVDEEAFEKELDGLGGMAPPPRKG